MKEYTLILLNDYGAIIKEFSNLKRLNKYYNRVRYKYTKAIIQDNKLIRKWELK